MLQRCDLWPRKKKHSCNWSLTSKEQTLMQMTSDLERTNTHAIDLWPRKNKHSCSWPPMTCNNRISLQVTRKKVELFLFSLEAVEGMGFGNTPQCSKVHFWPSHKGPADNMAILCKSFPDELQLPSCKMIVTCSFTSQLNTFLKFLRWWISRLLTSWLQACYRQMIKASLFQ